MRGRIVRLRRAQIKVGSNARRRSRSGWQLLAWLEGREERVALGHQGGLEWPPNVECWIVPPDPTASRRAEQGRDLVKNVGIRL